MSNKNSRTGNPWVIFLEQRMDGVSDIIYVLF